LLSQAIQILIQKCEAVLTDMDRHHGMGCGEGGDDDEMLTGSEDEDEDSD
jgi:hypothetical protein